MQFVLIVLPLVLIVLALARRRFWARMPNWLWCVGEIALVAIAFGISWSMVVVFNDLAEAKPTEDFSERALPTAFFVPLFVALVPATARGIVAGALLAFMSFLAVADLLYFRFFGSVIPLLAVGSSGQIWDVRDIIFDNLKPRDALYLPTFLAGIALLLLWRRPSFGWRDHWRLRLPLYVAVVGACLCFAAPAYGHLTSWMATARSWRIINAADSVRNTGFVGTHMREISRTVREELLAEELTPEKIEKIAVFYRKRAQSLKKAPYKGILKDKNLLIVLSESMQQWVIGTRANGHEITPFLNQLRKRSFYFPNIFDQTYQSPTADCEYLVFNSQHGMNHGSVAFRFAGNHFVSVPKLFRAAGYHTFSAHAYDRGMWNRGVLHPAYGFEHSLFRQEIGRGNPKVGWGLGDKQFLQRLGLRLKAVRQPFMAFAITLTAHPPYWYIPGRQRTIRAGALAGSKLGHYIYSMRYVDEAFDGLFRRMEQAKLLDNTAVVIFGDHDNKLKLDRKDRRNAMRVLDLPDDAINRMARKHISMDKVPFIIALPKTSRQEPREFLTIGGQIDIGATLLHLFGLKRPRSFLGQSLTRGREGHAVRADGSMIRGNRIFLNRRGGRCLAHPSGRRLPRGQCRGMRRQANRELEMSWVVTRSDLARRIAE